MCAVWFTYKEKADRMGELWGTLCLKMQIHLQRKEMQYNLVHNAVGVNVCCYHGHNARLLCHCWKKDEGTRSHRVDQGSPANKDTLGISYNGTGVSAIKILCGSQIVEQPGVLPKILWGTNTMEQGCSATKILWGSHTMEQGCSSTEILCGSHTMEQSWPATYVLWGSLTVLPQNSS